MVHQGNFATLHDDKAINFETEPVKIVSLAIFAALSNAHNTNLDVPEAPSHCKLQIAMMSIKLK